MNGPVFLDVSQFAQAPYASGIQRVISKIAEAWPSYLTEAVLGYQVEGGALRFVAIEDGAAVLRLPFDADAGESPRTVAKRVRTSLKEMAIGEIPEADLPGPFSTYVLPEPTYMPSVLARVDRLVSVAPRRVAAIFYDAIPQTDPAVWPARHQIGSSRYFRTVASIQRVAAISEWSLDVLARLRNAPVTEGDTVLQLGADGLGRARPAVPRRHPYHLLLGTLEERKNTGCVLDAFEQLWVDGGSHRLVVAGRPAHGETVISGRLSDLVDEHPGLVTWHKGASDADVRALIVNATSVLYPSEIEGYGLPPVESLALGVPSLVSAKLPALAGLPPGGRIELDVVDATSVAGAIRRFADPAENRRLRQQIGGMELPTWAECAEQLAGWLGGGDAYREADHVDAHA